MHLILEQFLITLRSKRDMSDNMFQHIRVSRCIITNSTKKQEHTLGST